MWEKGVPRLKKIWRGHGIPFRQKQCFLGLEEGEGEKERGWGKDGKERDGGREEEDRKEERRVRGRGEGDWSTVVAFWQCPKAMSDRASEVGPLNWEVGPLNTTGRTDFTSPRVPQLSTAPEQKIQQGQKGQGEVIITGQMAAGAGNSWIPALCEALRAW